MPAQNSTVALKGFEFRGETRGGRVGVGVKGLTA
jgi:hypothetical protein